MITGYTINENRLKYEFEYIKGMLERFRLMGEYVGLCSLIFQRSVEVEIREMEYSMNMMKMLSEKKPEEIKGNNYWFNLDEEGYFKRIEVLEKIINFI